MYSKSIEIALIIVRLLFPSPNYCFLFEIMKRIFDSLPTRKCQPSPILVYLYEYCFPHLSKIIPGYLISRPPPHLTHSPPQRFWTNLKKQVQKRIMRKRSLTAPCLAIEDFLMMFMKIVLRNSQNRVHRGSYLTSQAQILQHLHYYLLLPPTRS